jgi:hypothetical protein
MVPEFAAAASTMYPLPIGAVDAAHVRLQSHAAEEDYFWIKEQFPSSSALDHYSRIFADWHPCRGIAKQEWSFSEDGDESHGGNRAVHRLIRQWANRANNRSVTLILEYRSAGVAYRISPDSDRQTVMVMRYKHRDAVKELAEMGITCEKKV